MRFQGRFWKSGNDLKYKKINIKIWHFTATFFTWTVVVVSNRFLSIDRPEFLWHSTQLSNLILFRMVNGWATCQMFRHPFWNSSWKSRTRCTYSVAIPDDYNSRRLTIWKIHALWIQHTIYRLPWAITYTTCPWDPSRYFLSLTRDRKCLIIVKSLDREQKNRSINVPRAMSSKSLKRFIKDEHTRRVLCIDPHKRIWANILTLSDSRDNRIR